MSSKNLWNYQLAEKILKQFKNNEEIVFESGFGPSGYPHIGTYGEIARPRHVIKALKDISDKKTKYIVFSDDMDGLRKVPLGMPEKLKEHLGKPVSQIPDPWGCCPSFSDHMIEQIKNWLEKQNLTYDVFKYSHKAYKGGEFNDGLKLLLKNVEKVNSIILPTMREDSRKGWSPFMPICEKCGKNLSTRVTSYNIEKNSISYICDKDTDNFKSCGYEAETSIFDGNVKVGWKIDWALRWHTYKVNFEMYGKDLMEAAQLSGKIVKTALSGRPPLGYFYEMFLDETGAKISKSIGKGLTVEDWFKVAPRNSLDLFLFKTPQKAKKLSMNMIPRYVDEYIDTITKYYELEPEKRIEDEKYKSTYEFIENVISKTSPYRYKVSFNLLTNLIAAVGKSDPEIIKKYVHKYEDKKEDSNLFLEDLILKAGNYVNEALETSIETYRPTSQELLCIKEFIEFLETGGHEEEEIQAKVFETSKKHELDPREFFSAIYKLLSKSTSGPRLGSFIFLMGENEVAERLKKAVN